MECEHDMGHMIPFGDIEVLPNWLFTHTWGVPSPFESGGAMRKPCSAALSSSSGPSKVMIGPGMGAPDGTGPTSGSLVNAGGAAGTLVSFPIWISRGGPGTAGLLNLTRSRSGNDRSFLTENPVSGFGDCCTFP